MKQRIRKAAQLMAAIMAGVLLTGCGNDTKVQETTATEQETQEGSEEQAAMGRYVESQLTLPEAFTEGTYLPRQLEKRGDDIFLYGIPNWKNEQPVEGKHGIIFRLQEDNSFVEVTPEWMKEPEPDYIVNDLKILANGDSHVLYYGQTQEEIYKLKYYDKQSDTVEAVDITFPEGGLTDAIFMENGTLLLYRGDVVFAYKSGETEYGNYYETMTPLFVYDEDKVITRPEMTLLEDGYLLLDAYSGEVLSQVTPDEVYPIHTTTVKPYHYLTWVIVEEEGLYVLTPEGIFFGQSEVESWQKLIDSETAPAISGRKWCHGMVKGYEEDFYLLLNTTLYRYAYDANIKAVQDKSLRVYSLQENNFVKKAIEDFQSDNPDFSVQYETAAQGVSKEDAIKKMNTQFAGGKGPDVIILDGLPMESYAEKGVLLDLNDVLQTVLEDDDYYGEVIRALETQDGLYGAASRFIPVFATGSEAVKPHADSIKELAEYAAGNAEERVFLFNFYDDKELNQTEFLKSLYTCYSTELYAADGKMTEETLKNWLQSAKLLYEDAFTNNSSPASESIIIYELHKLNQILGLSEGALTFLPYEYGEPQFAAQAMHYEGYGSWYTGRYVTGTVVGVCAATKYPKEAGVLAAHLFSADNQKQYIAADYRVWSPVQKDAFREIAQKAEQENIGEIYNEEFFSDSEYSLYPITGQDIEWYRNQLTQDGYAVPDFEGVADRVLTVLYELAPGYLKGEKTLDSVSGEIQNRILLMENE